MSKLLSATICLLATAALAVQLEPQFVDLAADHEAECGGGSEARSQATASTTAI